MRQVLSLSDAISDLEIYLGGGEPKDGVPERPGKAYGGGIRRKMAGNRVLLLGRLRELALYRAEVLRDRGFDVKIPAEAKEAVAEVTRGAYDVAVLSYTLSNDEVQRMAELVRQACPDCPLVVISQTGRLDTKVDPDVTVLADEGPAALIRVLVRLRGYH